MKKESIIWISISIVVVLLIILITKGGSGKDNYMSGNEGVFASSEDSATVNMSDVEGDSICVEVAEEESGNENDSQDQASAGFSFSNLTTLSVASSLTSSSWRSMIDNTNYTDFVRSADGMVTATSYSKCICYNGQCGVCGGMGVTGQTFITCVLCRGTGKCTNCGGNGYVVTKSTYRYIDEYYSDGFYVLHVASSPNGPTVYSGGMGYIYYPVNRQSVGDDGNYYRFGGEVVYGVQAQSFRLSKDYLKLWVGDNEYVLIDKPSYERRSAEIQKLNQNASAMQNSASPNINVGGNPVGQNVNTQTGRTRCSLCRGSGSCSNPASPYNSKTYCHGSGRCPICGGDGYMENRYDPLHNIRCSSCHGNGRCQTCLGTGQCKRCGGSGYI